MKSIIQEDKECFLCRKIFNSAKISHLENHHIFYGTANRRNSDRYGLTVWLCNHHHRHSKDGVHFNKQLDLYLKKVAQRRFESFYKDLKFIDIFGKNYLES